MDSKKLEKLRRDYSGEELREALLSPNPITQFESWFDQALKAGVAEPHTMILATVSPDGSPSARVVLLRGVDEDGFTFYTNYGSRKSKEISANPKVAVVFYWHEIDRQVRAEGTAVRLKGAESDRYFAARPRESQIAAWASSQSSVLSGRSELEERYKEFDLKFRDMPVPRPENWGGFKIKPTRVEFWQGRPGRLHDRVLYVANAGAWEISRLAP
jgi:pyridoxamine 5'-phosphate oxidase